MLEDTGFTDWLDSGRGVLGFRRLDEAVEAVREVEANYHVHCRIAREIAETWFDSRKVLPELLDQVMSAPAAAAVSEPA